MNNTRNLNSNSNDVSTTVPVIIYILFLSNIVIPFTGIIGLIIAYIYNDQDNYLDSHYQYQIRTFWIGLLYLFISFILTTIVIGWLMFLLVTLWLIIRCVKGLRFLSRNQSIPNAKTWLF